MLNGVSWSELPSEAAKLQQAVNAAFEPAEAMTAAFA
jgi:hypothetical protein